MSMCPGSRLGPFEILTAIGAGGMGEVYRARDTRLDRDVAIKVLNENLALDRAALVRFEREAQLLAALNHPNVATVYGFEVAEAKKFLVLEFVEGQSLDQRLRDGLLSVSEAQAICVQIAAALEAAHATGVIHRDIKPANVMVKADGTVKVLDFGLARSNPEGATCAATTSTQTIGASTPGSFLGTACYASPEQARAQRVSYQTDIWSFGCVLFEALTGRRAFDGETTSDVLGAILHREPEWSALPERTPSSTRWVLRRCLAKDCRERLHSIADVRLILQDKGVRILSPSTLVDADGTLARERDVFCRVINTLIPNGNLQSALPSQAAELQSMADVHAAVEFLLHELAGASLLPQDVAYFAYRMNRPLPIPCANSSTAAPSETRPSQLVYQMAVSNRQRGKCRPGLKMHDRSNIARVYTSGHADLYAHRADAVFESWNQPLEGELFFRAFPVKVDGVSIGVVGLSAATTTDDQLIRFQRIGTNLALLFGLIFEVLARRTIQSNEGKIGTRLRAVIADYYDGLLPESQI